MWSEKLQELGLLPTVVVLNDWVDDPKPKPRALSEFADGAGRSRDPIAVTMALLRRDCPASPAAAARRRRVHRRPRRHDRLGDQLDHSSSRSRVRRAPARPTAARTIIHALDRLPASGSASPPSATSRSTTCSRKIIDDLRASTATRRLRAVRKPRDRSRQTLTGVTDMATTTAAPQPSSTSSPGRPGCSSERDMRDAPVDVLIIDEAGQLRSPTRSPPRARPAT